MRKNSLLKSFAFFAIAISMFSCKHKDSGGADPFVTFDPYDKDIAKRVEAYHSTNTPNIANSKTGNPSIYMDFSSGIKSALKVATIKGFVNTCLSEITGKGNVSVYKLGHNSVSLSVVTDKSLPDTFYNPGGDIYAPLEAAVDSITQKDNDALLITDFEEIEKNGKEKIVGNFLKSYFLKWINKGNSIHFYIADYREDNKVDKHIYFTIFNCGNADENSMLTKLQDKLKLPNYTLSNKTYKLSPKYPTVHSGGIFYDQTGKTEKDKNVLDLKDNYLSGVNKGNFFEFYPIGLDWKHIDKFHSTFTHLFRNLFIDLNNEDAFTYSDFDVKVNDATEDFVFFAKCNEALHHKPQITIGTNGESKFSDNEKDPTALSCYDSKGILKDEWKYKPKELKALPELFVLNKELFNNTKTSHKDNVEFAILFDSKFNVKNITNPDGLVKVDIVINKASPSLGNPMLNKFKWKSLTQTNSENTALYTSITSTLDDITPTNKSIYTYYIKTNIK